MTSRSSALLAVLALAVVSAGCLSGGPLSNGDESTPTLTPASVPTDPAAPDPAATDHPATEPTPTATDGTPTSIPEGWQAAANEPDPNKSIALENDWSEGVSIHLEVVRNATGETVHAITRSNRARTGGCTTPVVPIRTASRSSRSS